MDALLSALSATRGIVCLVGAGGKKTTMYALARAHPGRVALSSTSHMYVYDEAAVDGVVRCDAAGHTEIPQGRVVAFAGQTDTHERVGGLRPEQIEAIWRRGKFDLFIIKADGARARWIKAPAAYEPIVPPFTDTVIPVISARVIGRTLGSGIAHRADRAAELMDISLETPIAPEHLARLLSSPEGALKGVGDAAVVPLINMVDDEEIHDAARRPPCAALDMTARFSRVVLASMKERRLVEIIERDASR
jgi:probable selenium-dependent hydroxylase accessory protein YqeC